MMKRWIGIFLLCGLCVTGREARAMEVNYIKWEDVLNTYVDENGLVDYAGLHAKRNILDEFIEVEIENADIYDLFDDDKKAFWINAYNALTMRLILDHYPLKFGGIRVINWGRPWSIKMTAAGRALSLGDIEHEILRKWRPMDPRIHFVINCASIGCPRLSNTHFDPDRLDDQLDRETRRFINDPDKVRLDRDKNILYYSEIFEWFKGDFLTVRPSILEYILRYLNTEDRNYILKNKAAIKLKTFSYDWGLNEQ